MKLRVKTRAFWGHFATRLVVGLLVASLPISIVLGLLLTTTASSSLTSATRNGSETIARMVALRMEDWISEREANVDVIAASASGQLGSPATTALLARIDKAYSDFTIIEVTDLAGRIEATSRSGRNFDPAGAAWFRPSRPATRF